MTIRSEDVDRIVGGGGEVRTSGGDKVGNVGQVYLDDETGQPSWVTVEHRTEHECPHIRLRRY